MRFHTFAMIIAGLASLSGITADEAHAKRFSRSQPIIIGVVLDGPSEKAAPIRAALEREVLALAGEEFKIRFPKNKRLQANWTANGITAAVDRLLADPQVDLIITLGVISSHDIARRKELSKPVIAAFIVNRQLQRVPYKDGKSGLPNLTYISYPTDFNRDIQAFHDMVGFTTLVCLADRLVVQAFADIEKTCESAARRVGAKGRRIDAAMSAEELLAALPDNTEAVYLAPLLRFSTEEYERLIQELNYRRLPTFALRGKHDVERGVLAAIAPAVTIERIVRRAALNVQRILLGEDAANLAVDLDARERLVINMATARAIGFSPKWTVLETAEQLYADDNGEGKELSLAKVVQEAARANLDIKAAEKSVLAGAQDIRQARSTLLPQLELSGDYLEIDEDRVFVPGQAQRTSSGSVTLNQLLYSEPAWANLAIQKQLQASRESERDQVRLDVVLDAANAYLDVLRAKSVERIQKENLALTRSNLDLARVRRRVGTASPSEVYRWESEIAIVRQNVNDAEAQRLQTEIALNRLRNRPLEQAFATIETGVDDPILLSSQKRLFEYTDNPAAFSVFRDFMVQEGLTTSPERKQFQAVIAAQERALESARRAYWQPELGLSADRTEIGSRSGVEVPAISDDKETTVAVQLRFPLITSGARSADKTRAYEALQQLRLQLRATDERVEQRIRSALHATRSSYAGIRLSREGTDAARRNLRVVRDGYSRGTATILDLLDAQNAAIVADQTAANAVFDFLKDLMEVERAISRFDFFLEPGDQTAWFKRLDAFYRERGLAPGKP